MSNLSAIKKVEEIMSPNELVVFDRPRGGREKSITLEKDRVYIVPEYQREIRWSTENVQVLIDDLKKGNKFLGTIILCTSEPKKFEIIDGQQRLTVITLIIKCLNEVLPDEKKRTAQCEIHNHSFPYFEDALSYNFDYKKIREENLRLFDNIISSDSQNQRGSFAEIWNSISERVKKLSMQERENLLLALCESEMSVIINEIEGTDTQRKFCVDYFIDINNKSVELDSLDIIRAYAFKEDFNNTTQRWVSIQNKCNALSGKVKYSREELFFQYFVCNVNKQIGFSISKLSNDYKIKEDVEVAGKKYASGTYVWNLFKNDKYYANLLIDLDEYLDFIDVVIASETGGNDKFKKYFCDENGNRVDETRILNAHTIINAILRNDDRIPKMMVLKYFLEVLRPDRVKRKNYKVISCINVIATIFTLNTKKKESNVIASKLLQEDWQKGIREYAEKMFQDVPGEIDYSKVIKENKVITIDSGLHAARRFLSLIDACEGELKTSNINEDLFKNRNITTGENNTEHFIINRGYSYALYMDDGITKDVEVVLPRKYRKYIASLANYIFLNSVINGGLKNRPVYEKIEILESCIDKKGIMAVIPSITSQKHYYLIKKYMYDESKYPKQKLESAKLKKEKIDLLRTYYMDYFFDEYMRVVNSLSNIDIIFSAEADYKLKKAGFSLNDEQQYTIDVDAVFSNVTAEIDEKRKSILLSVELYNPMYGEENGKEEYEALIEHVSDLLTKYFGKEPCIRSSLEYSDCDDESVTFEYKIDSCDEMMISAFIENVSLVSSQIA